MEPKEPTTRELYDLMLGLKSEMGDMKSEMGDMKSEMNTRFDKLDRSVADLTEYIRGDNGLPGLFRGYDITQENVQVLEEDVDSLKKSNRDLQQRVTAVEGAVSNKS